MVNLDCSSQRGSEIASLPFWPKVLQDLKLESGTILQYVDDFLICSLTDGLAKDQAMGALNFLADGGLKVSKKKAQLVKQGHLFGFYPDARNEGSLSGISTDHTEIAPDYYQ